MIVDGVMEGGELEKAVMYVLNIWKNTGEMAAAIGVKEEDIRGEGGVDAITQGYYKQVSAVLDAGKEGILSPGEVMVEVKLLSTVRDMLITAKRNVTRRGKECI